MVEETKQVHVDGTTITFDIQKPCLIFETLKSSGVNVTLIQDQTICIS